MKKLINIHSLAFVLTMTFLGLSLIILVLVTGLNMYFNFSTQESVIFSQQKLTANHAADTVLQFIDNKYQVLESQAKLGNLLKLQQSDGNLQFEKILSFEPAFRQLFLATIDRQELLHAEKTYANATKFSDMMGDDVYKSISNDKNYISQVYIDQHSNEPMVTIAVPVKDLFGDTKAVLAAEFSLKFMWDLVGGIKIGEQGLAYVVNKQGDLIAFGDSSRVLKEENLAKLGEVAKFINGDGISNDEKTATQSLGINGTKVLTTYTPLGKPNWAVVTEVPVDEAYAEIYASMKTSLYVMLLCLLLAIIMSAGITRPIKDLSKMALKIGQGDFSVTAEIKSDNEIGQLALSINTMVEMLQKTREYMQAEIDKLKDELEKQKKA